MIKIRFDGAQFFVRIRHQKNEMKQQIKQQTDANKIAGFAKVNLSNPAFFRIVISVWLSIWLYATSTAMKRETGIMIKSNQGKIKMNRLRKSLMAMPFSVTNLINEIALENQISTINTPTITKK